MKLLVIAVALLLAGGVAGAQIVSPSKIIERLVPVDTKGGWVKIDKRPGKTGHERVYCITVDSMLSCDWNDVRKIKASPVIFE